MTNRVLPTELTEDLKDILGRPNFMCINLAECLRADGRVIARKSEDEQAAVIFWLLGFYLTDPTNWHQLAREEIKRIEVKHIEAKVKAKESS